jgi:hypothetical protein
LVFLHCADERSGRPLTVLYDSPLRLTTAMKIVSSSPKDRSILSATKSSNSSWRGHRSKFYDGLKANVSFFPTHCTIITFRGLLLIPYSLYCPCPLGCFQQIHPTYLLCLSVDRRPLLLLYFPRLDLAIGVRAAHSKSVHLRKLGHLR